MKYFRNGAFALMISIGLGSCALSSQYCDAYNGVELECASSIESTDSVDDVID
jgi:hypothetical protein